MEILGFLFACNAAFSDICGLRAEMHALELPGVTGNNYHLDTGSPGVVMVATRLRLSDVAWVHSQASAQSSQIVRGTE